MSALPIKLTYFLPVLAVSATLLASACGTSGKGVQHENLDDQGVTQGEGKDEPGNKPDLNLVFPPTEGVTAANGAFAVKAVWAKGPSVDPDNQLALIFATKDHGTISSLANVTVAPFMPSMGHGAPVKHLKVAPDLRNFAYDVEGLNFIMPGGWTLTVTATVDGVTGAAVINVDVP